VSARQVAVDRLRRRPTAEALDADCKSQRRQRNKVDRAAARIQFISSPVSFIRRGRV
jgi:hypothetical protein